ncbi:reverse transcriptase domain-containing protein [Tanacetum coccineum]|uniref:Reverse transcriptase domain-containing protein n=1 Tax=Tanacetum coccineum TaxID=301880 RepID=A0ABQ5C709_9ASTR
MAEGDADKMAFFAGEGVFCYRNMPFGLKNAGATYQRLVDKVFPDQIGRNLKAYVDDMVIKRRLITKQGIRANPSKVKAITDVEQLKTLKDVQSLNRKIAALNRFLSKGAKRSLPFFKVLKSYTDKTNIQWTQEAEAALQEMKKFMEILPTLTTPVQGEVLMMYLTASTESISATLFTKREEEKVPIYFVSRVLQGAELNYPRMEKLILALTLMKPEKSRRVAKWVIELGEHDIMFQERGDETPKDFLIEVPLKDNKKEAEEKADTKLTKMELSCEWKLFTDGAASSDDSQLLVNQIKGTYAAKQPTIREYLQKTKEALKDFDSYTIEHIRRNQNKKADALSKLASMTFEHLTKEVLVEVLPKRSIEEKEIIQVETKEGESWMTPIHEYLVSGLLPEDPKESRKIRVKAPQYKLIRGNLYRRSFYTSWLRCVASPQTDDIVKEVHEGSCGFNAEPRSMLVRITKQGYYWPSMHRDAAKVHRTLPRNSQKETLFSLTYGSEAIIPIFENDVAKDDRGRIKEVDKRRGSKEIASIEEAYYRSKLCRHHNKRSSHFIYKIGDFVLLSQKNTGSTQV